MCPCPILTCSLGTAPGTKVLLKNPEFYNGRLLLRQKAIQVLGGLVQELYDAWKAQEGVTA